MLVFVLGMLLCVVARPVAMLGEISGAILGGSPLGEPPAMADPLLLWFVRLQGLALMAVSPYV